jgi:hypothetical protein
METRKTRPAPTCAPPTPDLYHHGEQEHSDITLFDLFRKERKRADRLQKQLDKLQRRFDRYRAVGAVRKLSARLIKAGKERQGQ